MDNKLMYEAVDLIEERQGFYKSLNELLQINKKEDYYIERDVFGYGLEIEVSAMVKRTHITFLKTMLTNIIRVMDYRGNFETDRTIKGDYGFEICLDPLEKDECILLYSKIREIIAFSNNILSTSNDLGCGLHINIRVEEEQKQLTYKKLIEYIKNSDSRLYSYNEYKNLVEFEDYETYYNYQKEISGKYLAINYLKENIVEIRCINPEVDIELLSKLFSDLESILGEQ